VLPDPQSGIESDTWEMTGQDLLAKIIGLRPPAEIMEKLRGLMETGQAALKGGADVQASDS
jgi:hypothetical protein